MCIYKLTGSNWKWIKIPLNIKEIKKHTFDNKEEQILVKYVLCQECAILGICYISNVHITDNAPYQ